MAAGANAKVRAMPRRRPPGAASRVEFQPRRLPSHRSHAPHPSSRWAIATFSIIGVVFVAIGFGLKAASDAVVEVSQQYDGTGTPAALAATAA